MHFKRSTRAPQRANPARSPLGSTRPGDFVHVFDFPAQRMMWKQVVDIYFDELGRGHVRAEGTTFYVAEGAIFGLARNLDLDAERMVA